MLTITELISPSICSFRIKLDRFPERIIYVKDIEFYHSKMNWMMHTIVAMITYCRYYNLNVPRVLALYFRDDIKVGIGNFLPTNYSFEMYCSELCCLQRALDSHYPHVKYGERYDTCIRKHLKRLLK